MWDKVGYVWNSMEKGLVWDMREEWDTFWDGVGHWKLMWVIRVWYIRGWSGA